MNAAPAATTARNGKATIRSVDIAASFEQTADSLEIQDANPFRVRTYRNAARMSRSCGSEMAALVAHGEKLTELSGIGSDFAERITEIVRTGKCSALEKIQEKVPRFTLELLKLPGNGPRRARIRLTAQIIAGGRPCSAISFMCEYPCPTSSRRKRQAHTRTSA